MWPWVFPNHVRDMEILSQSGLKQRCESPCWRKIKFHLLFFAEDRVKYAVWFKYHNGINLVALNVFGFLARTEHYIFLT